MPKKRTWSEANNDEPTNEGSDPEFQRANKAKRAKLAWSDTPLTKSLWSRFKTACSQWSSSFTANFFGNDTHKNGKETIRLEILHQSSIQFPVYDITTLKDEILMACKDGEVHVINVYDRNNLAELKDVIPLKGVRARSIAGCGVSNCVYVLNVESKSVSVLRVTKDEHQFNVSPWIKDLLQSFSSFSVAANGNLIVTLQRREFPAEISIYNANGSLQRQVVLATNTYGYRYVDSVIQKSNGNLVVFSLNLPLGQDLIELDKNGIILRQYQSSTLESIETSLADVQDKILISYPQDIIELLDNEFNVLEFTGPQPVKGRKKPKPIEGHTHDKWHYNSERNEVVRILRDDKYENGVLTIYCFKKE